MVTSAIDISSLQEQLDGCPKAHHVGDYLGKKLDANGFVETISQVVSERGDGQNFYASNGFLRKGGAIIAWSVPPQSLRRGVRIVGAHSDSPGLRIQPNPDFLAAVEAQFSKDDKLIVGCQAGPRSIAASKKLEEAGFKELVYVEGGYGAWSRDESLPVSR